ncbi:MAG: hypothetical protein EOO60_02915, partial [Hymenobacter sp.]
MAMSENAELEELIRRTTTGADGSPPISTAVTEDEEAEGSFDISTLVLAVRRSLPWAALLIMLGLMSSWLYLRYTKPIYRASSVLKIDERSNASDLGLGALAGSDNSSSQLSGEVELIKSNLTYKRLKQVVPLDVNYYTQGTVLETELFGNSPFKV